MGYGLCGSAALGALAPWRRGGAVCLSFGSCVYEARGADATRAVYVQARQRLTGRPRNETHAHHRTVELPFSGYGGSSTLYLHGSTPCFCVFGPTLFIGKAGRLLQRHIHGLAFANVGDASPTLHVCINCKKQDCWVSWRALNPGICLAAARWARRGPPGRRARGEGKKIGHEPRRVFFLIRSASCLALHESRTPLHSHAFPCFACGCP